MTASLPTTRLNDLSQECGLTIFPEGQNRFADLVAIAAMPRYQVRCLENADEAENIALNAYRAGKRVLWVVNTVNRCQTIAKKLGNLCYHSRFRLIDRKRQHERVIRAFGKDKGAVLAITTQVCEMGLDLDADVLISEKAPVTSMIQRMGRSNRHAKIGDYKLGQVYFYIPEDQTPYDSTQLTGADAFINALHDKIVSQNHLQNLLEEYGPSDVEVEKYAAFLESGPWASSREESLRDENHFTTNALLNDDIQSFFALRSQKKPIDGFAGTSPTAVCQSGPENRAISFNRLCQTLPSRIWVFRFSFGGNFMNKFLLENDKLKIEYSLLDLPTAQHKAGLAGLLVMIESMKLRKISPLPEVDITPTGAAVCFTKESLQVIFDDLFNAELVEKTSSIKWKDQIPKKIIEVEVEVNGKKKKQKRFIYDAVQPKGAFLQTYFSDGDGLWIKLWRDMLWNILRGIPTTRNVYKERAEKKPSSEANRIWDVFIKAYHQQIRG